MAAKIHPELAAKLRSEEAADVEAILIAAHGLDDLVAHLPEGAVVEHRYRLIEGIAVRCSVPMLKRIATLPSVAAIEPVRDVNSW